MPRGVPGGWPTSPSPAATNDRPRPAPSRARGPATAALALDAPSPGSRGRTNHPCPRWASRRGRGGATARRLRGVAEGDGGKGRRPPVGVTGACAGATAWARCARRGGRPRSPPRWERLRPAVPSVVRAFTRPTGTFATEHRVGHRAAGVVGLSPLLRFMRYEPGGGRHLGHYDAGYDYGDGRRTLLSVVFTSPTRPPAARRASPRRPGHLPRRATSATGRDARDDEVLASVLRGRRRPGLRPPHLSTWRAGGGPGDRVKASGATWCMKPCRRAPAMLEDPP